MNKITEDIFRTPVENTVCNNRYLVSVSAGPNANGGCSSIFVNFQLAGWLPGDEGTFLSWNFDNSGQVYTINKCIDLDTLAFNCVNRIGFIWNDDINCCS